MQVRCYYMGMMSNKLGLNAPMRTKSSYNIHTSDILPVQMWILKEVAFLQPFDAWPAETIQQETWIELSKKKKSWE